MTWLCIGDSISEKGYRTTKNYYDFVAEDLGLDVLIDGISGSGFLQKGEQSYLSRQKKYYPAPDVITIMGSLNDLSYIDEPRPHMEISVRHAIDEYVSRTLEYYPLSFIAIISPLSRSYVYGPCWYIDALEETAKHYSLPFLDIYSGTALRPWIRENNKIYFSSPEFPDGDGIHPNEQGHKIMARRISSFLRTYI